MHPLDDDARVAARPVMAVAREQPDAIAVTMNYEAEAVIFDLMNPFRRRRHLGATGRDGGLKTHAVEIGTAEHISSALRPQPGAWSWSWL